MIIFVNLLLFSLAVASISETITRSNLFLKLRKLIKKISENTKLPFLGELFYCPYCLAHWISFGIVLINYPLFVVPGFGLFLNSFNFFIFSFALITLSVPWMLLIELFFNQLERY